MEQPRVLVVEDDLELCEIYAELLTEDGLHCDIINDGQIALDWLDQYTPDAILLDMHLPNVSGIEILQYIHRCNRLHAIPVMAITADANVAALVQNQVEIVLLKPASLSQVASLARRLL